MTATVADLEKFENEDQPAGQETPVQQVDYFGFSRNDRYTFPDGITYMELKALNEGAKKEYQRSTRSDVVMERNSGNARLNLDQAKERHEMIRQSVTDWNLTRGGNPVPFTPKNMADFLTLADPTIVEGLEKAIRKLNPWMLGDMSAEEIQKEMDNLAEMLEVAKERERGEDSSSSKQKSS